MYSPQDFLCIRAMLNPHTDCQFKAAIVIRITCGNTNEQSAITPIRPTKPALHVYINFTFIVCVCMIV